MALNEISFSYYILLSNSSFFILPSNSSSTKSRYNVDTYMILQKEISSFSSLGCEIIFGGDFNSRLGDKHKDYILSDTTEFLPIDSSITETDIFTFRNSQDKKTNTNGKHFLMSSMAWVKRCYSEKSKNLNKLLVFEALYP